MTTATLPSYTESAIIGPMDKLLATDNLYRPDAAIHKQRCMLRVELIRCAVDLHRENNPSYDMYCDKKGFRSSHLETEADLGMVPLLASGLFKRKSLELSSLTSDCSARKTTSSGTQGTVSVVPRDDLTIMRFFSSVAIGKREVLGVETFDRQVINLTPHTHEVPDLWIAYVMAGVNVLYTTTSYVSGGELDSTALVADLRGAFRGEDVNIVGPPALLSDLSERLLSEGCLALGRDSLIITIGGWKQREREAIRREDLDQRLGKAFGIADCTQVRDTYNMVELNTVIFECEHKRKHCPPWLRVMARDYDSLSPLPSGKTGILSFLDPTPTSYPGFVLSDDFGTVSYNCECACGIVGDVLSVERRMNRVEARGCALKLETTRV